MGKRVKCSKKEKISNPIRKPHGGRQLLARVTISFLMGLSCLPPQKADIKFISFFLKESKVSKYLKTHSCSQPSLHNCLIRCPEWEGLLGLGCWIQYQKKKEVAGTSKQNHPLGLLASGCSSAPNSANANCSAPPVFHASPSSPHQTICGSPSQQASGLGPRGQQEWGGEQGEEGELGECGELQRKERQNLGRKKDREWLLTLFVPNFFLLLELPNLSTHLKQVQKHLIKMIPWLRVTQMALFPPVKQKPMG